MNNQHPTPVVTGLTQEHVDRAREGDFTVQRCSNDGHFWYPPSANCPLCLGTEFEWTSVSGSASLWSWVVIHQPYIPAFADETPYLVAFVQLDEGPYLMSTIVDVEPDQLTVGARLKLELEDYGAEATPMPVFRLA